jgi:hypothetical protein
VLADDSHSMSLGRCNFQVVLAIDVSCIGPALAVVHHTVSWVRVSPWESISVQRQRAPVGSDAALICCRRDAVGDEVAWDTSCHCMGPQHPA